MAAASVMTPLDDEGVVLPPATYWVELEFDRPTPKADVLAALEQIGFVDVTLDQDTTDQGGLFRAGALSLATAPKLSLASTTLSPTSAVHTATLSMAPKTVTPPTHAIVNAPTASATTFTPPNISSAPAAPGPGPLGPSAPGVEDSSAAAPAPAPAAQPEPYFVDPQTGLQYFHDPASGQSYAVDPQSGQQFPVDPQTGRAVLPTETAALGGDVPYGADPAYALSTDQIQGNVLDEVSGTSPWVYRFVARMPYTVTVSNVPGMFWKCIRTLSIDPWAEINFSVRPLPLKTNATYELRFMSRDKKARARGDVRALLEAMGFEPQKLILFRKNVRIPKRPNVSVSEWLAVAKWVKAKSVTTSEDPFFFAEAREI